MCVRMSTGRSTASPRIASTARASRSGPSAVRGSRSSAASSVRCISRCTADWSSWRLPGK